MVLVLRGREQHWEDGACEGGYMDTEHGGGRVMEDFQARRAPD